MDSAQYGGEAHEACRRALRRDARRNRELVLIAAAEEFAARGLDAPLEEIARRAGVGIATLYRRFPTREDLIDAVFADRLEAEVQVAAKALAHEDPWEGFAWYVEQLCEHAFDDRGLGEFMAMYLSRAAEVEDARRRRTELVDQVVARARENGSLRADFATEDLAFIIWAQANIAVATKDVAPQVWRRHLALILDACRAEAAHPLPQPPLTPDQLTQAMRALGRSACPSTSTC